MGGQNDTYYSRVTTTTYSKEEEDTDSSSHPVIRCTDHLDSRSSTVVDKNSEYEFDTDYIGGADGNGWMTDSEEED